MYVGSSLRAAWLPGWRHVLGLSFIGPNVAAAFSPFASCLRLQLSAKPFWATWSGCQKKEKVTKTMADSLFWAQIEHDLAPVTRDQTPAPRTSSRWSRQFTVTRPRDLLNQLAAVAACTLTKGSNNFEVLYTLSRVYSVRSILKSWVNTNYWLYTRCVQRVRWLFKFRGMYFRLLFFFCLLCWSTHPEHLYQVSNV